MSISKLGKSIFYNILNWEKSIFHLFFSIFFTGREDNVQCVGCSAEIGEWELGDSPEIEHNKVSPFCVFVADVEGPNDKNVHEGKSIENIVNEESNEADMDVHEDIKVEEMHIDKINNANSIVHEGKSIESIVNNESNDTDIDIHVYLKNVLMSIFKSFMIYMWKKL